MVGQRHVGEVKHFVPFRVAGLRAHQQAREMAGLVSKKRVDRMHVTGDVPHAFGVRSMPVGVEMDIPKVDRPTFGHRSDKSLPTNRLKPRGLHVPGGGV